MSKFYLPPHPNRRGIGAELVTPSLRLVYAVICVLTISALVFAAVAALSAKLLHVRPDFFGPLIGRAVASGMTGFAMMMTLLIADWLALEFFANRRWPRARTRITSAEVTHFDLPGGDEVVEGARHGFEARLRGNVVTDDGMREMDIVPTLQRAIPRREKLEAHLAARIVQGECEVAIEPGENGRAFLLPWHTPKGLCFLLLFIPWALAGAILFSVISQPDRFRDRSSRMPLPRSTPVVMPARTPAGPIARTIEWQVRTEDGRAVIAQTRMELIRAAASAAVTRDRESYLPAAVTLPGVVPFGVPEGFTGTLLLVLSANRYASRSSACQLRDARPISFDPSITLWRSRFAVVRYARNITGGRALIGRDAPEMKAVVGHVGQLPRFRNDWDFWQGPTQQTDPTPGDVMIARHFRSGKNIGFQVLPPGAAFESITEAPKDGYTPRTIRLEKGLFFVARTAGPGGEAYGKFLIEEIGLDRPQNLPLIGSP